MRLQNVDKKKSNITIINNGLLTQLNVLVKLFVKWVSVSLTSKILLVVKIENKIVFHGIIRLNTSNYQN